MPVNKPRRPRRLTVPTQSPSRSLTQGANKGMRLANKLAKQYEEAQRRVARDQARSNRTRAGRQPTAQDTFTATNASPATADEFGHRASEDDFSESVIERITEAELVQLGLWDEFDAPGEDSPTATEYYSPTRSINPGRPRTREMTYNRQTRVLRVVYRSGGTYDYFNVPGTIWYRIKQVRSPGRFINRNILGEFRYEKVAGS